ncbi:MAG: hypothetical protein DCC55_10420 [Chloroflexi bacterium]|nr:MAG: hypothetical protein DCC55_10420 [Chloroflexota bacterium]
MQTQTPFDTAPPDVLAPGDTLQEGFAPAGRSQDTLVEDGHAQSSHGLDDLAQVERTSAWLRLTVEHALYGWLLLVAAGLRFFTLAAQPLNNLEAANVWPAWLAAAGREAPALPAAASPLFFAVDTLLFWIAGGSDVLARSTPALAGVATILPLWWLRPWLGREVALVAALLIAIDPWLTTFSRLADGAAFSVFFALLTLSGLAMLLHLPTTASSLSRWRAVTAVAAGLLLVSGPLAWSFVVVLALFLVQFDPGLHQVREKGLGSRRDLLTFAATAILGATAWLAQPAGLGMVSTSLSVWLRSLSGGDEAVYPLSWWLLRLVVDQPMLVVFGLLGFARLWLVAVDEETLAADPLLRRRVVWRSFLTAWLLWGLLLGFLPGRNPLSLPMIGLPLLLAAADLIAIIFRRLPTGVVWRESWLLLGLVSVLLISASFWGLALVSQRQFDLVIARGMVLFLLLAALTVVLYALWADWRQAWLLVGSYGSMIFLLVALSSNWQLNHRFQFNEPDGFFAGYTDPDVRQLVENVRLLSAQRTGDAGEMPILVQMARPQGAGQVAQPDPVLGWYLRDMRNLSWVLAPGGEAQPGQQAPLVITLGEGSSDTTLAGYMGSRYRLRTYWLPSQLLPSGETPPETVSGPVARLGQAWERWLRNLMRWLLFRKLPAPPPADQVVLWVRGGE